ncbi:ATP-binding protein [Pikeienuella piscinae]|uniref:ATP-binding protein n=1 Tax=Pikeienuella piscinae TaxID=2748098 RepID=A0A7L5BTC5_9RHOB|nr:ATP-binding protein [Pikeienuella piscinae]QIE54835.1 ATP-binding protein [Pikeienuella piscinae]
MARLSRRIGETLTEVAEAAAAAEAFCSADGADQSQSLRIGLALDELAANALVHGAMREEAPDITVEVWTDERDLTLRISARGPRFDPRAPRDVSRPQEYALGGRGLTMVLAFADELTYQRESGRNVTTFSVRKHREHDVD